MYVFKGGEAVEEGTYWEAEKNRKVVLKAHGFLPGNDKDIYLRLPESYLLIPVLLFGLGLSVALPYGTGLALFGLMFVLHNVLFCLMTACEEVFGELAGYLSATYKPTISYFTGRAKKRKGSKGSEKGRNA